MRVILTAVMVVWLLVGCATPEEPEATASSPRDTYLSFCPDVMHRGKAEPCERLHGLS